MLKINNILHNHQTSKKKRLSFQNLFAKNSPLIFCNASLPSFTFLSLQHRSDVYTSKPFKINRENSRSPPKAFNAIKPRRKRVWKTNQSVSYHPKSQRSSRLPLSIPFLFERSSSMNNNNNNNNNNKLYLPY